MRLATSRGAVLLFALAAACGGNDTPTQPTKRVSPDVILGNVTVSPQATVIAAGGSQQLTLSGVTLSGGSVAAFDTVVYTSSDSTRVKVSAAGLVTAVAGSKGVTSGAVRVVAFATLDGVTRSDTSYVSVVLNPGTAPTFSILDTAALHIKIPSLTTRPVSPIVTYQGPGGTQATLPASAVPIKIRVTPSATAQITATNQFRPVASTGSITVYAATTIFGVTLTDSMTYQLGDPIAYSILMYNTGLNFYQGTTASPSAAFNNQTTIYLQIGGKITFQNNMLFQPYVFSVTFTEKNGGATPADIAKLDGNFATSRQTVTFAAPGTYTYTWGGDADKLVPQNQRSSIVVVR